MQGRGQTELILRAGGCDDGALGPKDLGGRAQAGRAWLSPKKNSKLALSSVVATS